MALVIFVIFKLDDVTTSSGYRIRLHRQDKEQETHPDWSHASGQHAGVSSNHG